MKENNEIILNPEQALTAVCLDLRRYEPQAMLCAEVLRVALDDAAAVSRDPNRGGLWVRTAAKQKLQYMEGAELIDFVCDRLSQTALSSHNLAGLCRRVFQTAVQTKPSGPHGQLRLHIHTGMGDFHCRLCGHCCRNLDYRQELSAQDVARWTAQRRDDILKWVGTTQGPNHKPVFRIWMIPDTNQYAAVCPFLKRGSANFQWICGIQETKPEICRHYPSTRKHAVMTGCRGFDPES